MILFGLYWTRLFPKHHTPKNEDQRVSSQCHDPYPVQAKVFFCSYGFKYTPAVWKLKKHRRYGNTIPLETFNFRFASVCMYSHLVIRPKKNSIQTLQTVPEMSQNERCSFPGTILEPDMLIFVYGRLCSTILTGWHSGTPVFLGVDVLSEPSGWYQTFQVPFKSFHFQQAWCSEGKVTERGHLELVDSLGFSALVAGCLFWWNMSCDWWGCCNYHHVGFDIGVYVYTVYQ